MSLFRSFSLPTAAIAGALVGASAVQPAFASNFQQFRFNTCSESGLCSVDFGVVPVGKRLEVASESCFLFSSAAPILVMDFVVLNANGAPTIHDYGVPVATGQNVGGSFIAAVNNQTFYVVAGGRKIRAVMTAGDASNLELDCKIAGQLLP